MEPENKQNLSSGRIKRFIKESAKNGLLVFVAILVFSVSWVAIATFTQNDNSGFFLVDFNGNQDGIVSMSDLTLRQNIDVDVTVGTASIGSAGTTGFFTTAEIRPASFSSWGNIRIVAPVYSTLQSILGSLYTCDATPTQIPGWQNMQFTGTSLYIDISTLSPTTYPCIRVQVYMENQTGNPALNPILDSLRVTWDPKSLFLVNVSTPSSVSAGSIYSANVSYSNSFVDATGVVVWMTLPTYLNGSVTNYTTAYNQNPQVTFSSATNGGVYTSGGTTVSGVTIPPNSVYWNLGSLVAGRAGNLIVRLQTASGWENGMTLLHTGHIKNATSLEVISDSNGNTAGAQTTNTIISSAPSPAMQKSVSGVARINGVNYVVNNPPSLTPIITYILTLQNQGPALGRETIFNPVVTDDISDILTKLTNVCGVANPFATRVTVNNNGSFSASDGVITWSTGLGSFGHVLPGGSVSVTYTVDYTGCPSAVFNNIANATADNISNVTDSESITVGIDTTPIGSFAKGDKINGLQSVIGGVDDNQYVQQTYGDTFSYLLHTANAGAVALGGIVMADKIPANDDFISASLPSNITGGQIYYNTGGSGNSPTSPPSYSVTGSGIIGAGWSTTVPSDPSDVEWVAFYVPCLNSQYFPAGPGNTDCQNQPQSVTASITVRIRPIGNVCLDTEIENTGVFEIYRASPNISNNVLNDIGVPLTRIDVEQTHAGPSLAVFSNNSSVNGPDYLQVGQNGTYTFNVSNNGNDSSLNTILTINVPQVNVNGTIRYMNFVNATGGNVVTIIDPGFGQIGTVIIDLGTIQSGTSKTATITFNLPNGTLSNSTFEVLGTVSGEDDNNCQTISSTVTAETSVESSPLLQAFKTVDERIIPGGDVIHYNINYRNTGTSPSTNTYIVDRIPQRAVFDTAYTTGTDTSGTSFTCVGCSVYFSTNTTDLPASLTTTDPITVQMINSYFTLGTQISPGVWIPNGYPPEDVLWVAWRVDNTSFTPPMLPAGGTTRRVGLTIRNDDNGPMSPLVPSPIGSIVSNSPGILADDIPQAVDNQVFTTILPDPGLFLDKTSDKEYLGAGEAFNWLVEYYNDSGNADTLVTLTDTLPAGVTLTGLYHTWNGTAVSAGMSSGETNILADPSVTVAGNQITFTPTSLRGGNLLKLEGGTLRLEMVVQNTVVSGTVLQNGIQGHFENPSGAYDVFDNDEVYVENPDLWIRKQPDITDPIAGDLVNYMLIVSNEGEHDAPNVLISDTLPAGLCYVPGSTIVVTPGWSLPEPDITGGPCNSNSTTITWDGVISNSSYPLATIPGLSGDIIIRYIVEVESAVPPGTSLINGAHIETDIPEDPVYPNDTGVAVTTPLADPFVNKQVQISVNPGANADYQITYGNNTRQQLNDSYIIDTLPDYNGDGRADMKIISVNGGNGEQFYYNNTPITGTPPTFDLASPLSNGWQTTFGTNTNHIAIVTGQLIAYAGPFVVDITLEATDPLTNIELPTGISLTNTAQIFLPPGINDQNYLNNTDTATVITPGIDLWVNKIGSMEGGFPGVGPGDPITYTIQFGNNGTVNACDVFVDDVISSTLNEAPVFHNAGNLMLYDSAGNQVFPEDTSGNPIFTPVNISVSGSSGNYTFQIGDSDTCLPPGSSGEFEIYVETDTGLSDGTVVSNTAVIGEDSPDVEDILINNTDISQTVVYRSDLTIQKSGISMGPDNTLGTGDDSPTQTAAGENVHYTLEYNNIGSAPANNSIITETVPTGMCYIDGSVTGYPADATLEFSDNNGASYSYSPTGPVDCNVTHFRVVFGSPIYPGNSNGEDLSIGALGTMTNVSQNINAGDAILKIARTVIPINFPSFRSLGYVDDFVRIESRDENNLVDLNGDGLTDVALEGIDDGRIFRNTSVLGNVSFDMVNPFVTNAYGPVMYEDLDNDGLKDLIHSNHTVLNTGQPYVSKNTSTASDIDFSIGTTISSLPQNSWIQAVEDFNNDGFKDLLFDPAVDPTGNNNPMVVKNLSTVGILSLDTAQYVGGVYPRSDCSYYQESDSIVLDMDGDNKKDIVLFCQGRRINIYRNLTDTSSTSNPISFSGPFTFVFPMVSSSSFDMVDFNNDDKEDVFYAFDNFITQGASTISVAVWENTSSSGTISVVNRLNHTDISGLPVNDSTSINSRYEMKLVDLNNDGFLDIAFSAKDTVPLPGTDYFLAYFENTTSSSGGTVSFGPLTKINYSFTGANSIKDLEFEDLDGDNKGDFIIGTSGNGIAVVRNTTANTSSPITFDTPVFTSVVSGASQLTVSDIDGNNKRDLTVSIGGQSYVLENTSSPGNISFGEVISLGATQTENDPTFNDFDNDGKKDLFIRSQFGLSSGPQTVAFKNNSVPGVISFGDNTNNGSYVVPVSKSGAGIWQRLQVSQEIPTGSTIEYTIYDDTCGGAPLIPTTTLPNQFVDISSMGSVNDVCLVIDFSTTSIISNPSLDGWQMTYTGGPGPQIGFDLQVSNTGSIPQSFVNNVTISTDSYEILDDNNSDDYTLSMTQADVQITKSVDLASADPGDTLTYVLNYRNDGPLDAHNVLVEDTLPTGVTPISWTQISGTDTVNCTIDYGLNKISCVDQNATDWVLSAGESGSIEIQAQIASSGTPISVTHTTQSDFSANDGETNVSTISVPGSVIPVNSTVEMDVNATSINFIEIYLYDENWNLIEGTSGNISDLINFTVTSLAPVTLQYIGPLPMNVNNIYINMSLSGGNISGYNFYAYDMTGDNIADQADGSTDFGSFNTWFADPIDLSLPFVLQTVSPGFSTVSNPGVTTTAPPATYVNHIDMPTTACPTGSRKWGTAILDINDPQNNVFVYVSDNASFPLFPIYSAPTIDQAFTMYGYTAPSTLYYHVQINRTDTSYFPEFNEITIETICDGGVTPGTVLTNSCTISTSTRDTDVGNNSCVATTIVGEFANLTVEKSGPTQVSIGSNFTYSIDVTNNGNAIAENITIQDILPSEVSYVSSSGTGAISFSCSQNLGIVSCNGSGDLDQGETATLLITVSIPNNIMLIGDVLHNEVSVSTTTNEVTVSDNFDEYDVTIIPLGTSSISGFVYIDGNGNNDKDTGEPGVENTRVFLAGRDIFGNVYGPDKTLEPLMYEKAMDTLIIMSVIPNRPYLSTDPYPARYFPITPDTTSATGSWIFSNYQPGAYAVFELQPVGYISTGSNAGYRNVDGLGNPIFDTVRDGDGSSEIITGPSLYDNSDVDSIINIIMADSENAVQYNFGEVNGSIGDLVFEDKNSDGTFNGTDVGIAGVEITIYEDLNLNGSVDVGEPSQTDTTDSNGLYLFTGINIGSQYIVEVTDSAGILSSYNAIVGPNPGANNNSQNPSGYLVLTSMANSSNLTADFGYHLPTTGCVGPNCGGGGGGCTGPSCNPTPTGSIGNQVFFDQNADGIFNNGDLGIPDVGITLYADVNSNGRIDPWDIERKMFTNQSGVYQFTGLDVTYQYIVYVSDENAVLMEFTHILGPNQALDNHSKDENRHLVALSALNPSYQGADFGYIGYELPRTGQSILGRIGFGAGLLAVTFLALRVFRRKENLTESINNFTMNNNGKS